jgi:carboxyl-terminal processing protease
VRVSNLFVNKGELIVSTKGKIENWDQDYYTTREPLDTDIPLIILVNRGSASASEIVAGALQDLDRAVVIGQRTFGKGLVQTTRKLKYNTQLKVTTAKYYIPSGRCIQALDYSNRNEDGSVGEIPDSLITAFETRNGRIVYDGGGIRPDLSDEQRLLSQVVLELYAQNMIFDFATQYVLQNPLQPDSVVFSLSDDGYRDFMDFVAGRDFSYETQSEDKLNELIETAKREKYYELAEDEFALLRSKLTHDNEKDLMAFKDEIIQLINEEIAGRYYFQRGRIATSVNSDTDVELAVSVLGDPEKYKSILQPEEDQKELATGERVENNNLILLR